MWKLAFHFTFALSLLVNCASADWVTYERSIEVDVTVLDSTGTVSDFYTGTLSRAFLAPAFDLLSSAGTVASIYLFLRFVAEIPVHIWQYPLIFVSGHAMVRSLNLLSPQEIRDSEGALKISMNHFALSGTARLLQRFIKGKRVKFELEDSSVFWGRASKLKLDVDERGNLIDGSAIFEVPSTFTSTRKSIEIAFSHLRPASVLRCQEHFYDLSE